MFLFRRALVSEAMGLPIRARPGRSARRAMHRMYAGGRFCKSAAHTSPSAGIQQRSLLRLCAWEERFEIQTSSRVRRHRIPSITS